MTQVKGLLKLAGRAWHASHQQDALEKNARHLDSYKTYLLSKPDYTPGVQKHSDIVDHEALHPREFGDSIDCMGTVDACHMLAMIVFCQIFNTGYGEKGNVAGNNSTFVEHHLGQILSRVNPAPDFFAGFQALRLQIENARDKMLAHADAAAFSVTSIPAGVSLKAHTEATRGIDFAAFTLVVDQLSVAIGPYIAERKARANG